MSYKVDEADKLTDEVYRAIIEAVMGGIHTAVALAEIAGVSRLTMQAWLRSPNAKGKLKKLQEDIAKLKEDPFEGARPLLQRAVLQATIAPRKKINRKLKIVKALTPAEEKQLKDLQGDEAVEMVKESGAVLMLEETEEIIEPDGTLAFKVLTKLTGGSLGITEDNVKELLVVEGKDGKLVEVEGEVVPALMRGKDAPRVE